MEKGGLKAQAVTLLLGSQNPILRKTASWIALHHAEWGDTLVTFFGPRVVADLADSEREDSASNSRNCPL